MRGFQAAARHSSALALPQLLLLLALLGLLGAPGCDSAAVAEDLDLDSFDDEETGEGLDMDAADDEALEPPPVEDFDKDLSEEDRRIRMRACLKHSSTRMKSQAEQLEERVKTIVEMGMMKERQLSKEQALNTIALSWMMQCYLSIDEAGIEAAGKGLDLSEEQENAVFVEAGNERQSFEQASKRQFQLLESIVMEENQKVAGKQASPSPPQQQSTSYQRASGGESTAQPQQGSTSAKFGTTYVILAFVLIFGIIGLAVRYLASVADGGRAKERSSKSLKKAEKRAKKTS